VRIHSSIQVAVLTAGRGRICIAREFDKQRGVCLWYMLLMFPVHEGHAMQTVAASDLTRQVVCAPAGYPGKFFSATFRLLQLLDLWCPVDWSGLSCVKNYQG